MDGTPAKRTHFYNPPSEEDEVTFEELMQYQDEYEMQQQDDYDLRQMDMAPTYSCKQPHERRVIIMGPSEIKISEKFTRMDRMQELLSVNCDAEGYKNNPSLMWIDEQRKLATAMKRMNQTTKLLGITFKRVVYKFLLDGREVDIPLGRYYPDRSAWRCGMLGLQSMYNVIRRLLVDGSCVEIDMRNAHPSILLQLCSKFMDLSSVDVSALRDYVRYRPEVLAELQSEGVGDLSKGLILRLMFGGSWVGFVKDHPEYAKVKMPRFVDRFQHCMSDIMREAPLAFNHLGFTLCEYAAVSKDKRHAMGSHEARRSALAIFMQDVESQVMGEVFQVLTERGLVVRSLIHDGILVEQDACKLTTDLMLELSKRVFEKSGGLQVEFGFKPLVARQSDLDFMEAHRPFMAVSKPLGELPAHGDIVKFLNYDHKVLSDSALIHFDKVKFCPTTIRTHHEDPLILFSVRLDLTPTRPTPPILTWMVRENGSSYILGVGEIETLINIGVMFCLSTLVRTPPRESIDERLPIDVLLSYNRSYGMTTIICESAIFDIGYQCIRPKEVFRSELNSDKEKCTNKPLVDLWMEHPLARRYTNTVFYPRGATSDFFFGRNASLPSFLLPDTYFQKGPDAFVSLDSTKFKFDPVDKFGVCVKVTDSENNVSIRKNLNIWNGWPSVAHQSIMKLTARPEHETDWPGLRLWLTLLQEGICGGDQLLYEFVLNWMAYGVQFPDRKPGTALVMTGDQGSGKGSIVQAYGACFGEKFFQHISQPDQLTGKFNAHFMHTLLVFADEATFGGNKSTAGIIKAMITEPTTKLEKKGVDAITVRSFMNVIIASNTEIPVVMEASDRRFVMIPTTNRFTGDTPMFDQLNLDMRVNGGQESLLVMLATRDLTHFVPNSKPKTSSIVNIQSLHMVQREWSSVENFIFDSLNLPSRMEDTPSYQHNPPASGFYFFGPRRVKTTDMHDMYLSQQKVRGSKGLQYEGAQSASFWNNVKKIFKADQTICSGSSENSGGVRYRTFPNQEICRRAFEVHAHQTAELLWDVDVE